VDRQHSKKWALARFFAEQKTPWLPGEAPAAIVCASSYSSIKLNTFRGEPQMKKLLQTYRGTVYPWHCDHVGHMNVMFYVGKFDEATWNLFAEVGITSSYLRNESRGMAAVQQNITYKRELHAGDVVAVRSWVLEVREKVVRYVHEMVNLETSDIAAFVEVTAVHLNTATRKACPMPPATVERLRQMIVPASAGAQFK
jgi:acyl-CoA thioester hydrolase